MNLNKKVNTGFTLIEVSISIVILLMLSWLLLKENVNAIRQRLWGVKFVMAQSALNAIKTQAGIIDKAVLIDPARDLQNPWSQSIDNVTPVKINIGRIPSINDATEGTTIDAFLLRSQEVNTNILGLTNVDLTQSVVFKANGFYYQISNTVTR